MTKIRQRKIFTGMTFIAFVMGLLAVGLPAVGATQVMAQDTPALYQPDPDSPIGERNENAPPELAMYDFVIGDWDATVTFTKPDGSEVKGKARWHNIWIGNGYVVMQEWRSPYTVGSEFRSYDAEKKKWLGQNIYFNSDWRATEIEFNDGNMIVFNPHAKDKNGPFINRETYYDISENSFKIKSDRSYDGGKTWQPGIYAIAAIRLR